VHFPLTIFASPKTAKHLPGVIGLQTSRLADRPGYGR